MPNNPDSKELSDWIRGLSQGGVGSQLKGAIVSPVYLERKPEHYAVSVLEMESLSEDAGETALWSSVSTFTLALFLAAVWDMVTTGSSEDFFWLGAIAYSVACLAISIFSVVQYVKKYKKRKRLLDRIVAETPKKGND